MKEFHIGSFNEFVPLVLTAKGDVPSPLAFYYRTPYENFTIEKLDMYLLGDHKSERDIINFFDSASLEAIRPLRKKGVKRDFIDSVDNLLNMLPLGLFDKHRKNVTQLRKRDLCEVIWYITSKWPYEYGLSGHEEFEWKILDYGDFLRRKLVKPLEKVLLESKNDCARFLAARYAKRMGLFGLELAMGLSQVAVNANEHLQTRNYAVATMTYLRNAMDMEQFAFILEEMLEHLGVYEEPVKMTLALAANHKTYTSGPYQFNYLQNEPAPDRTQNLDFKSG